MNTLQVSPAAIVTCSACPRVGTIALACAESLTTWRGWTATDDGPRCPCCKPTP